MKHWRWIENSLIEIINSLQKYWSWKINKICTLKRFKNWIQLWRIQSLVKIQLRFKTWEKSISWNSLQKMHIIWNSFFKKIKNMKVRIKCCKMTCWRILMIFKFKERKLKDWPMKFTDSKVNRICKQIILMHSYKRSKTRKKIINWSTIMK